MSQVSQRLILLSVEVHGLVSGNIYRKPWFLHVFTPKIGRKAVNVPLQFWNLRQDQLPKPSATLHLGALGDLLLGHLPANKQGGAGGVPSK